MSSQSEVHLKLGENAAKHIDAYAEYRRIVGDDDGGTPFTEEQYENYKKTVGAKRLTNRVYVSWTNTNGMDCKLIGPETPCFCGHRYKQHKTDLEEVNEQIELLVPCRQRGCRCRCYSYLPTNGGRPIRCSCKHEAGDHSEVDPLRCKKGCDAGKCPGFRSSFSCPCGQPTYKHRTILETKSQRLARGHPVGVDTIYQAMGALTGFSSLADGYQRMDPSGIGAPSQQVLDQPVTPFDHPFIRGNVSLCHQSELVENKMQNEKVSACLRILTNSLQLCPVSTMRAYEMLNENLPDAEFERRMDNLHLDDALIRRPGESELDYYERMYQMKQKKSPITKGLRRGGRGRGGASLK